MPRLPRVVVPGLPQHITHGGDHRQQTFFCARLHMQVRDDRLVKVVPLLERVGDWREVLSAGVEAEALDRFRRHERTGRPLGSDGFLARLERMLRRILRPQKPGLKPEANPR